MYQRAEQTRRTVYLDGKCLKHLRHLQAWLPQLPAFIYSMIPENFIAYSETIAFLEGIPHEWLLCWRQPAALLLAGQPEFDGLHYEILARMKSILQRLQSYPDAAKVLWLVSLSD